MTRQALLQPSSEADTDYVDPRDRSDVSLLPRARARILIVDDEPLFGQTISMLLGAENEVVVEHTGKSALERLSKDADFDLVLCDVSLPDLTGPDVYEKVRASNAALASRFVFVTGGAFTEATRNFLDRHTGVSLEKPFRISELERLLDLVCTRSALSA